MREEAATALPSLPEAPGAYRWYYADVVAGDTTAVFILMLGSLFSPRYAARSCAVPLQHCAVNFALYRRGVRQQWVLSEYTGAQADGRSLRIGNSRLHYHPDGTVDFFVRARCAPFGPVTKVGLTLRPEAPGLPPQTLVEGLSHRWTPLVPRAQATLRLPLLGEVLEGVGYHDCNAGEVPLGTDLPGWTWARVHAPDATHVHYQLPAAQALSLSATPRQARLVRMHQTPAPGVRTGWGLLVPSSLQAGPVRLPAPRLLESSPFYARLEAASGTAQALGEVADFRRFRSPLVRWMAHFRTRVETAA
jgi:carotenoid 1,2-hydratase